MSEFPTLVVPARLASTRFPRKLLQEFNGKPLIVAVGERLRQQVPEYPLIFAVDSEELALPLREEQFQVFLTDPNHSSGTDRIAEVARNIGAKWIINVQGDEPLIHREHIQRLTQLLQKNEAPMVTLATPFTSFATASNPNIVKVVRNQQGKALYFSRSVIPYDRSSEEQDHDAPLFYQHLGLYGFTKEFLQRFTELPPSPLEKREKLEQLRALDYGYSILVGITDKPTIGIDTPEDLEQLKRSF